MSRLDAKNVKHPCEECKMKNKETCGRINNCVKWNKWFSEKWEEVTKPFKTEDKRYE